MDRRRQTNDQPLGVMPPFVGSELELSWIDQVATAMGRRIGTRGAILCFHGIDLASSPSTLHVCPSLFEVMVATARSLGTVVPLADLVGRHRAGRSTEGLIALTADDAYVSLLALEPFLTREDVSLTVFVISGALARGPSFWWDRLDDVCTHAPADRWRRFEDHCGVPDRYRRGQPAHEGRLRPLRQWVLAEHAGRWPTALEPPLAQLEADLGRRTTQRAMTADELAGFAARAGVQIGVHTISHAVLPLLPDDEVIGEVAGCHRALRERFANVLPYLAAPFGLFDARTLTLAHEAGMDVSLTLAGTPLGGSYVRELGIPRLCMVQDYTPGMVALHITGVASVVNRIRGKVTTPYPPLPSATS